MAQRLEEEKFPHTHGFDPIDKIESKEQQPALKPLSSEMSDLVHKALTVAKDRKSSRLTLSSHSRRNSNNSDLLKRTSSVSCPANSTADQGTIKTQPEENAESLSNDVITYADPEGRMAKRRMLENVADDDETSKKLKVTQEDEEVDKLSDESAVNIRIKESMQAVTDDDNAHEVSAPDSLQEYVSMTKPNENQMTAIANWANSLSTSCDNGKRTRLRKFMLSSMSVMDKKKATEMIRKIGGIVYEDTAWKLECTHLVVGKLNRSEKFLSALASRKWSVL